MPKPVIVGIDPGTTVGYAILNLNGNLIHLNSSRTLSPNGLIQTLIEFGQPVIIATDKHPPPTSVQSIASSFRAVLWSPSEDISRVEKRHATKSTLYANDHEMDALASAIIAQQKYLPLFRKVDKVLREQEKFHLSDTVKSYVIRHPDANITLALEIIEANAQTKKRLERIVEKKQTPQDIQYLHTRITKIERENFLIGEEKKQLLQTNKQLRKELQRVQQSTSQKKIKALQSRRAKRLLHELHSLKQNHTSLYKRVRQQESQFRNLERCIHNFDEYVLLKKLPTLGAHKLHNINPHDILYIENPTIYSQTTVNHLQKYVQIIVYNKEPSKKIRQMLLFHFIPAMSLDIQDFEHFAFVPKKQFLLQKAKLNMLDMAIREYKLSRDT